MHKETQPFEASQRQHRHWMFCKMRCRVVKVHRPPGCRRPFASRLLARLFACSFCCLASRVLRLRKRQRAAALIFLVTSGDNDRILILSQSDLDVSIHLPCAILPRRIWTCSREIQQPRTCYPAAAGPCRSGMSSSFAPSFR